MSLMIPPQTFLLKQTWYPHLWVAWGSFHFQRYLLYLKVPPRVKHTLYAHSLLCKRSLCRVCWGYVHLHYCICRGWFSGNRCMLHQWMKVIIMSTLWIILFGIVPILIYGMRFYITLLPQLQLWHLHWLVSIVHWWSV